MIGAQEKEVVRIGELAVVQVNDGDSLKYCGTMKMARSRQIWGVL